MEIERLVRESMTAHEHLVPDTEEVLAATRRRIGRRRAVLGRPLAVAAGVVVLALAAVTVVALTRSGDDPTDRIRVAAPTETPTPRSTDLVMPYDLGWLPPGSVDYLARRINVGADSADSKPLYGGEYMLTVTTDGHVIDIDVQEFKMVPADEATFKSGPGNPVTINGKHGVESANSGEPGGYELYLTHPEAGSMYVNVMPANGQTAPAQQLVDIGRRVAENIHFPGTATVTPAFGLGDLPGGLRMCAFDVGKGFGPTPDGSTYNTSYEIGTCDTMPTVHVSLAGTEPPHGVPGQPVQGHETRVNDEDGYHTLYILDAVKGAAIGVAGSVPQADLYAVANGLVLPE